MKLQKRGKLNRYFYDLYSTTGFFYEGKFYEGYINDYPNMNINNQSISLFDKVKTVKAFKRWLRVNPYNAPKGTEFLLVNIFCKNAIKGKIK